MENLTFISKDENVSFGLHWLPQYGKLKSVFMHSHPLERKLLVYPPSFRNLTLAGHPTPWNICDVSRGGIDIFWN